MTKYTEILKLKKMLEEANIPIESFTDDFFGMKAISDNELYKEFYPAYCLRLNANIDCIEHYGSYGN